MTARTETGLLTEAAAWWLAGRLFERPVPGYEEAIAALASEVKDEDLETAARADERVKQLIESRHVVKVIVVPGRLVNFVV